MYSIIASRKWLRFITNERRYPQPAGEYNSRVNNEIYNNTKNRRDLPFEAHIFLMKIHEMFLEIYFTYVCVKTLTFAIYGLLYLVNPLTP